MKALLKNLQEIEAAREELRRPSFTAQLFAGQPDFSLIIPFPTQSPEDRAIGDAFCAQVEQFLHAHVDPVEIERTGVIPRSVIDGLNELGCFGLAIPREYGGLGFSQTNYDRVLELIGSYCNVLALLLSVHQSIGASRPLLLFGSEEQKRKWLPRLARGAISAFALTEPGIGSDPANMKTTATLDESGSHYVVNGEKLWCTNGPIAEVLVLTAKVDGRVTAFVVETNTPGIEVLHRCSFMGCRGIENGWIRFQNVAVPTENVIGQVGRGLRVALTTLNTGRVSLAALCLGMAKQVLPPTIAWANHRQTFGKTIGQHELNTHKVARMAADVFAIEAVCYLVAGAVDRGAADYRIEAAIAKLVASEKLWSIVDQAMQLRGGRGYETAESLRARGESPEPIEQLMRDARLYLIGEGASEILKLFIAREALDPHLQRARRFEEREGIGRLTGAIGLGLGYARWYAEQWLPAGLPAHVRDAVSDPRLRALLTEVATTSRRLARVSFTNMLRYREQLEQRQALVARMAEIAVDLFIVTAVVAYAEAHRTGIPLALRVADDARVRIAERFRAIERNSDEALADVGRDVLAGQYHWLNEGAASAPSEPIEAVAAIPHGERA